MTKSSISLISLTPCVRHVGAVAVAMPVVAFAAVPTVVAAVVPVAVASRRRFLLLLLLLPQSERGRQRDHHDVVRLGGGGNGHASIVPLLVTFFQLIWESVGFLPGCRWPPRALLPRRLFNLFFFFFLLLLLSAFIQDLLPLQKLSGQRLCRIFFNTTTPVRFPRFSSVPGLSLTPLKCGSSSSSSSRFSLRRSTMKGFLL